MLNSVPVISLRAGALSKRPGCEDYFNYQPGLPHSGKVVYNIVQFKMFPPPVKTSCPFLTAEK